jgi:lipopolysaccharide transport system permease protein
LPPISPVAEAAPRSARWGWLLYSFTRREILSRYADSVTGLAWTLLNPLAQLAIFAFVFTQIFRAGVPPEYPGVAYVTFVAVALWPWIMFSEGLVSAMGSIAANGGLIRKVAFPHRLLVYAAVFGCCAVHLVGFLAVILVLRAMGQPISLYGLPVAAVLLVPYILLATGIGALLAALQTLLRDVAHVVQVLVMILFYASPILYPTSLAPEIFRKWLQVNPLAWFSERLRAVLLQGSGFVPGDLVAAAGCVAVFALGLWVFNRLSPSFEEFL